MNPRNQTHKTIAISAQTHDELKRYSKQSKIKLYGLIDDAWRMYKKKYKIN